MKLLLTTLSLALSFACARKSLPKQPNFNETIVSPPAKALTLTELKKDTNVMLTLTFGGRPADQDLQIQFLDQKGKIVFDGTWHELKEKMNSESCSSIYSMVDDFNDTLTLSCDNEIDFTEVNSARATNSDGRTRYATSVTAVQVYDDMMQVFVPLL
jgi:hypothetical protein